MARVIGFRSLRVGIGAFDIVSSTYRCNAMSDSIQGGGGLKPKNDYEL